MGIDRVYTAQKKESRKKESQDMSKRMTNVTAEKQDRGE